MEELLNKENFEYKDDYVFYILLKIIQDIIYHRKEKIDISTIPTEAPCTFIGSRLKTKDYDFIIDSNIVFKHNNEEITIEGNGISETIAWLISCIVYLKKKNILDDFKNFWSWDENAKNLIFKHTSDNLESN
jgi:hypothetical protein